MAKTITDFSFNKLKPAFKDGHGPGEMELYFLNDGTDNYPGETYSGIHTPDGSGIRLVGGE